MMDFKSLEKFQISGRGTVYAVEAPFEFQRDKCPIKKGMDVKIDGEIFRVIGIEMYCIPTIHKGMKIGIFVDPPFRHGDRAPAGCRRS